MLRRWLGQLVDSALRAPAAILRLSPRAWLYLGIYLIACVAVLAGLAGLLFAYREGIRATLLSYLLPEGWHFAASTLIDGVLDNQQRIVLINAVVSGGLVLVATFLFPLKELLSKTFEVDAKLTEKPVEEFPLWLQAWEEIKLLLLYVTVQVTIFWIGYHPAAFRRVCAVTLSLLFLAFAFAIDFIAPVLQRHKGRYSQILKLLLKRPVASIVFGTLFALPPVVVGLVWKSHHDWGTGAALTAVFGVAVVCIAWAAVSGTWLGSRWLDALGQTKPSGWPARLIAWVTMILFLTVSGVVFARLGTVVHHKSQILKCRYHLDPGSVGIDRPTLGALLRKRVDVGVHADVEIENPTRVPVKLEKNRVEIVHAKKVVALTQLTPVEVPPGESVTKRLAFKLEVSPAALRKGKELLDLKSWKITLYVRIAPEMDFPVYLWPRRKRG